MPVQEGADGVGRSRMDASAWRTRADADTGPEKGRCGERCLVARTEVVADVSRGGVGWKPVHGGAHTA